MKEHNENTIPPTVLTLADNSWRSKEFRTRTVLIEEAGKKVIRKFATTKESNTFLKAIAERERANAKYLKEHFDVLCGSLKGDHIEYEYLRYPSLSQIIASKLNQNHCEQADELLRCYIQKVHVLGNVKVCPKKFLSMIGQNTISNCDVKVICLPRGLLDLTPRNILVDENKWIVVDNEWSFDFPIPVVFVLFRAILELVVGFQKEIRRTTKKTRPAIGLLSWSLRTYYYPANWVRHVSDTQIDFAQMLRWEMGFQRYITGYKGKAVGYIKIKNPRTKFSLSTRGLRSNKNVQNVINYMKHLPGVQGLVYLIERLIHFLQKQ